MLIDSHCHLQFKSYKDDLDQVLARCNEKDMIMNTVGTQKDTSKKSVEIAEKHENVYATIGLHPTHLFATEVVEEESSFLSREEEFDEEFYGELAKSKKVIAIGECGLDLFHLPKDISREVVLEKQKEVFLQQIKFATERSLPVVIHCRDAYDQLIVILSEAKNLSKEKINSSSNSNMQPRTEVSKDPSPDLGRVQDDIKGVVHCFSGNPVQADALLKMGFHLGFTGVITFPPKKLDPQPQLDLIEVIKNTPLDKMLTETDAPFLAPQKYRGERCEPWMTEEVVKKIAEIKGVSEKQVLKQVEENFRELFGI